jgi:putative aldouronate transport system permease protein
MKRSLGEKIFGVFNTFFMIILIFATVYPLWYVLVSSFSSPVAVAAGWTVFLPSGITFDSYQKVASMPYIWTSYANTIFYSVVGTAISMAFTILGGYALSKKRLVGRKAFTFIIMVTMWFGAGMIPTYLNFKDLGLLDTRLGVLLCFAINTFNVILMRTYFENVPESLEESAKIDGANDWHVLISIYLPVSVPALATLTMYYFVGRWNAYFWAMLLIKTQSLVPLQVLLTRLIVQVSYTVNQAVDMSENTMNEQTVIYATIVMAVIPMLVLYPFIQKYFIKGIMVGAIKG